MNKNKQTNLLIPKGAKKLDENFLAEGEVTGHAHRLNGAIGVDFQIYEKDGVKFCELLKDTKITHEEHMVQELRRADFEQGMEIHIVQEYDHFLEESRHVVD